MFLPLKDNNPLQTIKFQTVTLLIAVICIMVYWLEINANEYNQAIMLMSFALIPVDLIQGQPIDYSVWPIFKPITLISSMFLHADIFHLSFNMLYLWIFSDNIEDAMGHWRFIAFYLIVGILAGLTHVLLYPFSNVPVIGASGAISGIMGAYLILYPNAKITVLFGMFIKHIPAYIVLITWILLQIAYSNSGGGVAWWVHIGGFIAGALLILPFKKKTVPLFGDRKAI